MSRSGPWDQQPSAANILLRGRSNSYRIPIWMHLLGMAVMAALIYYEFSRSHDPERFVKGLYIALFATAMGWGVKTKVQKFNDGREWVIAPEGIYFNNRPFVPIETITKVGGWWHRVTITRRDTGWRAIKLIRVENAEETRNLLRQLTGGQKEAG